MEIARWVKQVKTLKWARDILPAIRGFVTNKSMFRRTQISLYKKKTHLTDHSKRVKKKREMCGKIVKGIQRRMQTGEVMSSSMMQRTQNQQRILRKVQRETAKFSDPLLYGVAPPSILGAKVCDTCALVSFLVCTCISAGIERIGVEIRQRRKDVRG